MTINQIELKNAELVANTLNIKTGVMTSAQGYLMIGEALNNIKIEKLWQDDFSSFAEYCETVLNVKQATAYRIIQTTTKYLLPEKDKKPAEVIFTPFNDTALAALNPVGDYDTTHEFIVENGITPATPVSEIRKIVNKCRKAEFMGETGIIEKPVSEPVEEVEEAEQPADELSTLIQIVANAEQLRDKRKRKQRIELKTAIEKIIEILEL